LITDSESKSGTEIKSIYECYQFKIDAGKYLKKNLRNETRNFFDPFHQFFEFPVVIHLLYEQ